MRKSVQWYRAVLDFVPRVLCNCGLLRCLIAIIPLTCLATSQVMENQLSPFAIRSVLCAVVFLLEGSLYALYCMWKLMKRTHHGLEKSLGTALQHTVNSPCNLGVSEVVANIAQNLLRLQNLATEIPKFVPSPALQKMMDGCDGSPQMINAAVVFLDIENYTGQLASRRGSRGDSLALLQQMNDAFGVFAAEIVAQQGVVDKVVGDCLMCFFPALANHSHDVRAVRAAVACFDVLTSLHKNWQIQGRDLLQIRVGIASGACFCGNFGAPGHRVQYTVMGDVVNIASRLQGLGKKYGERIIVSRSVVEGIMWDPLASAWTVSALGRETLRGRESVSDLYCLKRLDPVADYSNDSPFVTS
eukprot:ANDGO_05953.mRNA.1 Adenylate cyclase 1